MTDRSGLRERNSCQARLPSRLTGIGEVASTRDDTRVMFYFIIVVAYRVIYTLHLIPFYILHSSTHYSIYITSSFLLYTNVTVETISVQRNNMNFSSFIDNRSGFYRGRFNRKQIVAKMLIDPFKVDVALILPTLLHSRARAR